LVNEQSDVVANCDNTLEKVHSTPTGARIAMGWVILQESLFEFHLPVYICNPLCTN
jgi:hypothetical protein